MCPITHTSFVALLTAVAASFVFGFLWYGPLFGKMWAKLAGIECDGNQNKKMPVWPMLIALLNTILQVGCLAYILKMYKTCCGYDAAFVVWLGFQVPLLLSSVAWERKPVQLFVLNASFYLLNLLLIAAIIKYCP